MQLFPYEAALLASLDAVVDEVPHNDSPTLVDLMNWKLVEAPAGKPFLTGHGHQTRGDLRAKSNETAPRKKGF
ncbi:hypothetical protein G3I15_25065 [Streptomyces sp. SID10244]|nr:hypothetical protein [Streptomyces sp. SID10244]